MQLSKAAPLVPNQCEYWARAQAMRILALSAFLVICWLGVFSQAQHSNEPVSFADNYAHTAANPVFSAGDQGAFCPAGPSALPAAKAALALCTGQENFRD